MSTLAAFRPVSVDALGFLAQFSVRQVGFVTLPDAYLEAIRAWGLSTHQGWYAVESWNGRDLDTLVNEGVALGADSSDMGRAWLRLAEASVEAAIW